MRSGRFRRGSRCFRFLSGPSAGRLALLLGLLHRIAEGGEGEGRPLSARAFSLPAGEGHQRAIAAAVLAPVAGVVVVAVRPMQWVMVLLLERPQGVDEVTTVLWAPARALASARRRWLESSPRR